MRCYLFHVKRFVLSRLPGFCLAFGPVLLLLLSSTASGQIGPRYSISYLDIISLKDNERIASNSILLKNPGKVPIRIGISLKIPTHWREVLKTDRQALQSIILEPEQSRAIALNLLPSPTASSLWDTVRMKVWDYDLQDTSEYHFRLKVKERPEYELNVENDKLNLSNDTDKIIRLRFHITNSGNVDDVYRVKSFNTGTEKILGLSKPLQFSIKAGQDSTIEISAKIKSSLWKSITNEILILHLTSNKLPATRPITYNIYKSASSAWQSHQQFRTFPLTIGGGIMLNGYTIKFYGQVGGSVKIGDHSFSFNYRSQNFGAEAYTYQRNIFYASYRYKYLSLEGGSIPGPKNFNTTGQGIRIGYSKGKFGLYAGALKFPSQIITPVMMSDNVYVHSYFNIKKVRIEQNAESNLNRYYGVNSYLLDNEVQLITTKTVRLQFSIGAGLNEKQRALPGVDRTTVGFSGTYQLSVKLKDWQINSSTRYKSLQYPGLYQGIHSQNHSIKYSFNKLYIQGSFRLNSYRRNILRDTLYNSDFLSSNNSKYGLGVGLSGDIISTSLILGHLQQQEVVAGLGNGNFADLTISTRLGKRSSITLSSLNALYDKTGNDHLFSTNLNLNARTRFINLTGSYNRVPALNENNPDKPDYRETVYGGPSVNFSLFNRSLSGSFRCTASKTISEDKTRIGVGGQINYLGKTNGFAIGISGFYPLQGIDNTIVPLTETRSGTMFFSKQINVPFSKYRLYDLNIILYYDENDNGKLDEQETRLDNAEIGIDKKTLLSNAEGEIAYRNVKPGLYQINLYNSKYIDLVAANGPVQFIDLNADKDFDIAFKKGKKLTGNLKIVLDSLSKTSLSPDKFIISITDSSKRAYSAITDEAGDFYIYIPDGTYNVSINPDAFKGSDFKPDKTSYTINLADNEVSFVQFTVRQKKRVIRFMNTEKK